MSLLKSEAKLSAVNELGCRLDDVLEKATQDLYRAEGALAALKQASTSMENLLKILDKELNEKEVDLESCSTIKSYVNRAYITVNNLVSAADNNRQAQAGKIQGFEQAVAVAKKFKDEELNKLQSMQRAIEENMKRETETDVEIRRTPGTRPGPPIKMRRLAEDAQASQENSEKVDRVDGEEDKEELTKTKPKKQKKQ